MSDFASAFSAHPDARVATGEALGQVMDAIPNPVTVVIGVTSSWRSNMANMIEAADALLSPDTLVGIESKRVGTGGNGLSVNGLAVWASTLSFDAQPLKVNKDGTGAPLPVVWPNYSSSAEHPVLGLYDGSAVDRDLLIDTLGAGPSILGELEFADGAKFYLGQEGSSIGILMRGPAAANTWAENGFRRVGEPWTVTSLEPNLELGGAPYHQRLDELGLSVSEATLSPIPISDTGEDAQSGISPVDNLIVGDLVSIWQVDRKVFGEGLSCLSAPPLLSAIGFGPLTMGISQEYERPNSIDFATTRQVLNKNNQTYNHSWAYGALGFG